MKLGHIFKYHTVFFKFANSLYRTMISGVITHLFMKIHHFYGVQAMSPVIIITTCWERADLLALVCGVSCEFVTFPLVSWVRCGT